VKPRVRRTATSRVRSRIDMAMVLAQTSKVVKITAPQMLMMNALTFAEAGDEIELEPPVRSRFLVGTGVPWNIPSMARATLGNVFRSIDASKVKAGGALDQLTDSSRYLAWK